MLLLTKIQEYIKKYDMKTLCNMSWINDRVFLSLLKQEHRKYHRNTLDILYSFFHIEKDKFYKDNIKKWYPKTESLLWTLVRFKRVRQNLSIHKLAKNIKMDSRALARIESWDALPYYNNWSVQHILEELNFSDEEKGKVKKYIEVMKNIEKLVKKYEI